MDIKKMTFSCVTQGDDRIQCFFFSLTVALANKIQYQQLRDKVLQTMELDKDNLLETINLYLSTLQALPLDVNDLCSPDVLNIRNLPDVAKADAYIRIMQTERSEVDEIVIEVYMCLFTIYMCIYVSLYSTHHMIYT